MYRSSIHHHAASAVAAALVVFLLGLPALVPLAFANGSLTSHTPALSAPALPELA